MGVTEHAVKDSDLPVLALDIGGTWTRAALVANQGVILAAEKEPTRSEGTGDDIVAACVRMLRAVAARRDARGLGVSITGPVDPASGVLFAPPNTGPALAGLPLQAALAQELGLPVVVDRDTNAAALAEISYGAGRGCSNLVYLTVSTGVGGAVVLDGRLLRGANGVAGEIGHVVVETGGPRCGCGRDGCLEAVASGPALVAAVRAGMLRGEDSILRRDTSPLDGAAVAAAAAAGDLLALRVMATARQAVASAAVDLVNVFNPERLVLGGSVILGNPVWVTDAEVAVARDALEPARTSARVVTAELGDDGGLLGAALLLGRDQAGR